VYAALSCYLLVYAALATSVCGLALLVLCGLQILVYAALSYWCMRPSDTSVCGLELLVSAALSMLTTDADVC
jgi:hypothetical protein